MVDGHSLHAQNPAYDTADADTSPWLAQVDASGRWMAVHVGLHDLLGLPAEAALPGSLHELLSAADAAAIAEAALALESGVRTVCRVVVTCRGAGDTGHLVRWTASAMQMPGRGARTVVAMLEPVTDGVARPAHAAATSPEATTLQRRAARYEALIHSASQLVWMAPANGLQTEPQPAWQAFTGQTDLEVLGLGWLDAVHADDRDNVAEAWASAMESQVAFAAEYRVRRHDGAYRWMRARGVPLCGADGEAEEFVGLNVDITDDRARLHLLQEREQLAHRLLGVVGHDLRNPLSTIVTSREVLHLLHGSAGEPTSRMLAAIDRAARRANELISTILDFAGAALSGGLHITPSELALLPLLEESVADARARHPDRVITLRMRQSDEAPAAAYHGRWDGARLQQALGNLLTNAVTHGTPGCAVHVRCDADPHRVYVEVTNASETIPPERLATLFDPLTAPSARERSASSGLGFGLYIVKQLVEAHGGRTWVTSQDQSTTFYLELPRDAQQPSTAFAEPSGVSERRAQTTPTAPRRAIPGFVWHMHDVHVRTLLLAWLNASTDDALPACEDVLGTDVRAALQDVCCVELVRDRDGSVSVFHFAEVGAALERRYGERLAGVTLALDDDGHDEQLRAWLQDYGDAAARAEPTYTYIQMAPVTATANTPGPLSQARRVERLVVPCSASRSGIATHLLSIVRFSGFDPDAPADGTDADQAL